MTTLIAIDSRRPGTVLNDTHPTCRDDNVHCGKFADENVNFDFDGAPDNEKGRWCRTTCTGQRWRYTGPLDNWARMHVLRHFGLDAPAVAALYPLERLATMTPQELRTASNARLHAGCTG